jgi:Spy/CpxP family protein refolding chaperone
MKTHVPLSKESTVIRSLVAALVLILALPLAALAQTAPPDAAPPVAASQAQPHHHHGRYLTAVHSLALTPDQTQQIRAFVRATRQANAGADAPTRRANARKLRQQIAGVLTPEQQTQLRAALAQQRAQATPQ